MISHSNATTKNTTSATDLCVPGSEESPDRAPPPRRGQGWFR